MSRRSKAWLLVAIAVVLGGGIVAFRINQKKHAATEGKLEQVSRRDLVSSVTASGKVQAKTSVDISADITGRIIDIAVREGDLVKRGQFLLQIDPAQYQAAVARSQGVVASTEATLLQTKATRDQAQRAWNRAEQLTKLGDNLIAPETAEQAHTALDVAEANYEATKAQLEQSRASLQEAKDNLAKTRLTAPINGRVVRLAVEEGEVAVPGTFSKETGLLMTIADLSVILSKVEVDETDVVRLSQNDSVEVTIDAYQDTTFWGRVTKISHSAKLTPTESASGSKDRAVDFDVEVTLRNPEGGVLIRIDRHLDRIVLAEPDHVGLVDVYLGEDHRQIGDGHQQTGLLGERPRDGDFAFLDRNPDHPAIDRSRQPGLRQIVLGFLEARARLLQLCLRCRIIRFCHIECSVCLLRRFRCNQVFAQLGQLLGPVPGSLSLVSGRLGLEQRCLG